MEEAQKQATEKWRQSGDNVSCNKDMNNTGVNRHRIPALCLAGSHHHQHCSARSSQLVKKVLCVSRTVCELDRTAVITESPTSLDKEPVLMAGSKETQPNRACIKSSRPLLAAVRETTMEC